MKRVQTCLIKRAFEQFQERVSQNIILYGNEHQIRFYHMTKRKEKNVQYRCVTKEIR